jgi:hypothetical protein
MAADMAARGYASMKETEKHWRTPNACAKAAFAPTHAILHSGSSKAIRGTVRSDGGKIAAGKWKRLRIGPGSVVSGLPGRSSRSSPASVKVRAGRPVASGATVLLKTRAVSRAGIAETAWRAEGEVPDLYYKIDEVTYSASYTGSLSGQGLPCSVHGSATENGHQAGLPFARDFDTLRATGNNYNGGLGVPPTSKAQRTAMLHGCDITASVSPPPPCDIAPTSEVAMTVGLGVTMPDNKPATITWQFPPATVAGDSDLVSNCYVGAITATPATVTTTRADRTVFLNPGPHEVSASQPVHVHVSLSGFATSVDGTATVRFKFHRVNADGTPFTG